MFFFSIYTCSLYTLVFPLVIHAPAGIPHSVLCSAALRYGLPYIIMTSVGVITSLIPVPVVFIGRE